MSPLFTVCFVLLATQLYIVFGQDPQGISTNATCDPSDAWMNNAMGQSPCLVAAYLAGSCNQGQFAVYALVNTGPYNPPEGDKVNRCSCSVPVYNLVQACSSCQLGDVSYWSGWVANCPVSDRSKMWPYQIPSGTSVPPWAYIDTTEIGWSASEAESYASSPSASVTPYVAGTSTPTSTQTSQKKSPKGAIAGGVIGGIAVVTLLILGGWYMHTRFVANNRRLSAGWAIDGNESLSMQQMPGSTTYAMEGHPTSVPSHDELGLITLFPYDPSNASTLR